MGRRIIDEDENEIHQIVISLALEMSEADYIVPLVIGKENEELTNWLSNQHLR